MVCKDCIHHSVCCDEYKDKLKCSEYKNKSDVEEVIHCKDCKKRGTRECIVNRKMDLMAHPTMKKVTGFCDEGERK